MIAGLLLACAVVAANAGFSLAAKAWTDAGDRDKRWGKAQAAAVALRLASFLAGLGGVWRATGRPGPVVLYVFAVSIGQLALQAYLLERKKI